MPGVVVLEDSDAASEPGEFDNAVTMISQKGRYLTKYALAGMTRGWHVQVYEPVCGHQRRGRADRENIGQANAAGGAEIQAGALAKISAQ